MEKREPVLDQGLVEEIIHLRTEMNARFIELEGKTDENTLAIKSLETVMKGGFENVSKILQEISNKLD